MAVGVRNSPEPGPRKIRLEASSFCQLRCPSCPTTTGAINPAVGSGFLRFDNFRALIDDNPSIDHIELSNYGEILLNPHLLKILEYAWSKAVAITFSNGVNLNHAKDELLEGLVKYRVCHITCSIDGATPETYQIYRVRGNFDRVIENIERINQFKRKHSSELPKLTWQFVVFGHNEHEIPAARQMADGPRQARRATPSGYASGWSSCPLSAAHLFRAPQSSATRQCPLWVISGHLRRKRSCPLYPESGHVWCN
jgi:MoaA/NifB/PqqE/SkfB family radical SAM enzyme